MGPLDDRIEFNVLWPLGRATGETVSMSTRLAGVTAKRIGFLWDYVFRGDDMFRLLAEELPQHFPDCRFVPYETFGNIHGHDEADVLAALPERLRLEGVDAVVVGVGA